MKILIVHNQYRIRSGEDVAIDNEIRALRELGHEVITYFVSNENLSSLWRAFLAGLTNIYNFRQKRIIFRILKSKVPDIVHVHNFFPRISPAVFYACNEANIPCIHTLHNYRIVCPSATLFNRGKPYYSGINRKYLKVILDRVYRNSAPATLLVLTAALIHRFIGTWRRVDLFIALSKFQKEIFQNFVDVNISVLPHFTVPVADLAPNLGNNAIDQHLFVGRLDHEKGIMKLLDVWPEKNHLVIVGEGPLSELVATHIATRENISMVGRKSREEVVALMRQSASVIVPSLCHETFGLVIIESYSVGTPVLVNKIEPLHSLVIDGETGYKFDVGSQKSLIEAIEKLEISAHNLRRRCFSEYNNRYTIAIGAVALEDLMIKVISERAMAQN